MPKPCCMQLAPHTSQLGNDALASVCIGVAKFRMEQLRGAVTLQASKEDSMKHSQYMPRTSRSGSSPPQCGFRVPRGNLSLIPHEAPQGLRREFPTKVCRKARGKWLQKALWRQLSAPNTGNLWQVVASCSCE